MLDRRNGLLEHTCESLQILQRRVEDRLYPLWDVFTALHVMSTGTYRLLPGIIETKLIEEHQIASAAAGNAALGNNPLKPPITEKQITSTISRLNNALHIALLSTVLPPDITRIRVEEGMAWLTYGEEFELAVSRRMGPPREEEQGGFGAVMEPEEERVHWRLFDLKVLMNVDQQSALTSDLHHAAATPQPLFNDSQLLHLNVLLNTIATGQPNPIQTMCSTMHHLMLVVLMDILHAQSVTLTKVYVDVQVEYSQASKILNIKYWRDVKEMPMEGVVTTPMISSRSPAAHPPASTAIDQKAKDLLLSPCLQLLLDSQDRLSIRHNPPLPPSPDFPDLLKLHLHSISMSSLLSNVVQSHANWRVEQLYEWIAREQKEKSRRAVAVCEMEIDQRKPKQTLPPSAAHVKSHGVVPRSHLLIRILPGYFLSIHTETQTGRFVMEWGASATSSSSTDANLTSFYPGSSSQLNRILHGENARLNYRVESIWEILLHLKMVCLTMQLAALASMQANPRARVFTMQPPFKAQPAIGLPSALTITQMIRHTVYDPQHYRTYSTQGANPELFRRPGFGPYTVYLQLNGYSSHYYVVLQLNPMDQLKPTCWLVQTEQQDPAKLPPIPVTSTVPGSAPKPHTIATVNPMQVVRAMWEMKWLEKGSELAAGAAAASSGAGSDPSIGFASSLYVPIVASLLSEAMSTLPFYILRRELQAHFSFNVMEARIVGKGKQGIQPDQKIPQALQDVILTRAAQVKETTSGAMDGSPHLIMGLNFPLNYTQYNPAHLSMDVKLDSASSGSGGVGAKDAHAHAVIFATPPSCFPKESQRRSDSEEPHAAVGAPAGFVVYFTHPLIGVLMTKFKQVDDAAAASPLWQRFSNSFGSTDSNAWLFDRASGVVTLTYDSLTTTRVSRMMYDLDNLYVHLCWFSNYVRAREENEISVLVVGAGADEVVEHNGQVNGAILHSQYTNATSLNPIYFPHDFFRCISFTCNALTFAYPNPNVTDVANPMCIVEVRRDHRLENWKRRHVMQQCMWQTDGCKPPKTPVTADLHDWAITMKPLEWPQLPLYTVEFNSNRPNNLLHLLHNVWVGHRTVPPIVHFLSSVQRWQRMGDLEGNHQLQRLYGVRKGSLLYCIPESATRLRLLFGQSDRGRIQDIMWRMKTDLRLLYEGEIVQDFKAGTTISGSRTAANDDGSMHHASAPSLLRSGKIGGDITSYLTRWYKYVAGEDWKQVVKLHERALKGAPTTTGATNGATTSEQQLVCGIRFEVSMGEESNLSSPIAQLIFPTAQQDPSGASPSNQLDPSAQYAVSAYFSHRLARPPYTTEPFSTFYRLLLCNKENQNVFQQNLQVMAEAWAMELLQPHPFPTPFPSSLDESILRRVLSHGNFPSSNTPLTFRFVWLHTSVMDTVFQPEQEMFACTLEVAETRWTKELARRSAVTEEMEKVNGHVAAAGAAAASSATAPFSVYLPLAYHVHKNILCRWDVPTRMQGGSAKRFLPLPPVSFMPPTFPTLTTALDAMLHCQLQQLTDWWSTPVGTQQPTSSPSAPAASISALSAATTSLQGSSPQESLQAPITSVKSEVMSIGSGSQNVTPSSQFTA